MRIAACVVALLFGCDGTPMPDRERGGSPKLAPPGAVPYEGILDTPGSDLTWFIEQSGTSAWLSSVSGTAADNIYVGGEDGTLLHSNGDGIWVSSGRATVDRISSLWVASRDELYAVVGGGNAQRRWGHVVHSTNGGAAFEIVMELDDPWHQVWGFDADNVFVARSEGFRSTDHGASWMEMPASLAGMSVRSVWASSALDIYFVGMGGRSQQGIRHSVDGGLTWADSTWLDNCEFGTAWGSGPNDVWIGGNCATVIHTTDGGLTHSSVPNDEFGVFAPFRIFGSGPADVFILALTGAGDHTDTTSLLHSKDGGTTWSVTTLPTGSAGWSAGPRDVYIVGDHGTILHGVR